MLKFSIPKSTGVIDKYRVLDDCFMKRFSFLLSTFAIFLLTACKQNELYERMEPVPGGEWKSNFQPSFTFNISDTTALYNVYITVRHTNNFPYNNLWVESSLQLPGDTLLKQKLDLQLASPEGWVGMGMDDIFEARIKVTPRPSSFPRNGPVTFTLKQIMRQDPLPGVLQVGMRIEKDRPVVRDSTIQTSSL
jgi:gliding motility-associated lipoprotein GldH